jgi:hypothetical protein
MGGVGGKEKKRKDKTKPNPKKRGTNFLLKTKLSCHSKSLPTMVGQVVVGAQ